MLNVSQSYFIELLKKKEISFYCFGTHRRILRSDLVEFKEKADKISQQAMEELIKEAQELNMDH